MDFLISSSNSRPISIHSGGLSEGLFLALYQLIETLPPALPIIQSRILSGLGDLLAGSSNSTTESEEIVKISLAALGGIELYAQLIE